MIILKLSLFSPFSLRASIYFFIATISEWNDLSPPCPCVEIVERAETCEFLENLVPTWYEGEIDDNPVLLPIAEIVCIFLFTSYVSRLNYFRNCYSLCECYSMNFHNYDLIPSISYVTFVNYLCRIVLSLDYIVYSITEDIYSIRSSSLL